MALSHALKTMTDMVRPDGGTFHVVDYDASGRMSAHLMNSANKSGRSLLPAGADLNSATCLLHSIQTTRR